MGAVQTDYSDSIGQAYIGMLVNTEPNNLISFEAEAAIEFGRVVQQGTADRQVTPADGAADIVRGIAVRAYEAISSSYAINDTVLVMDRGVLWVEAGGVCAVGGPVYMVPASGKYVTASSSNLLVPNAVFDSSAATDGDLVKIRVK